MNTTGTVIGLARRAGRRLPMETVARAEITVEAGLAGDHKGARLKRRQVTLMAIEDWQAALSELADRAPTLPGLPPPAPLEWTVRRANILTRGLRLPRAPGAILVIGAVRLEVTAQTSPCRRMEEVASGLLKALSPNWRGGVTARVLAAGPVAIGDVITIQSSPPERTRVLP